MREIMHDLNSNFHGESCKDCMFILKFNLYISHLKDKVKQQRLAGGYPIITVFR